MSIVFSKNKEKRSRSSASDTNNSFVKNITSRVSGLIPATITKWFSSSSSSNTNGSVAADGSDSSTDDEGPDTPIITQPPAKRMRFNSPGSNFSQYAPEPPPQVHLESPEIQNSQLLYNTIQSPPGRNTFLRDTTYSPYITPVEVSNIEVVNTDRFDRDLTYKSPHIVTATSHSVATKRKSIFETNVAPKPKKPCVHETTITKTNKQPSYKPALFGSPFYPGRTMYGGASSSAYINQPNIKQRKVAYVKESPMDNECVSMSSSARRVMDLLENYSSPLMEAKRIPVIRKYDNSKNSDTSTQSPSTSRGYSYKTQELYVASISPIMQWKQRSRLMDTTKVARQIIASHSSTLSGFQPDVSDTPVKTDTNKHANKECTNKFKTRLTRPQRGEDQFELPEPVQLPTAVLKIDKDNLPKFSISAPVVSQLSVSTAKPHQSPFSQPTNTKTSITETPVRGNIFKFATPVRLPQDVQLNSTKSHKFTFGDPKSSVDKPKVLVEKQTPLPQSLSLNTNKTECTVIKSTVAKSKEWKCPECWISNKAEVEKCVCCGAKQSKDANAEKPTKCAVCKFANATPGASKCINCEKADMQGHNSIPLPIPQPADPSKWKCEDCWVSNEESADKCACCGSRSPAVAAAVVAKPPPQEKDWKCEDCWISNKSRVDKCAACGGVKPSAPSPLPAYQSPFAKPPDEKLAEIARAQKAKWECSGCLVRNDANKTECMCCGMERDGPSKEITAKPFNFPKESNVNFKFGIDPREQEAEIAKKVDGVFKMEPARKLQESETNNNIPTFTFTIPNKKSEDKLDGVKSVGAPKMAFTFGIRQPDGKPAPAPAFGAGNPAPSVSADSPAPSVSANNPAPSVSANNPAPSVAASTSALSSVAAGNPAPSVVTSDTAPAVEEKPQVPKVDFKASSQKGAFASGFFAQKRPQESTPKPFSSFVAPKPQTNETKEAPMNPSSFPSAGSSAEKLQPFAFGANVQVFGSAPSAVTTSFPAPQQTAPVTSSARTASLFASPAAVQPAAPTTSIFGAESAPASQPAPAPAAPLFSFGTNSQSAAPAPDKSKFNFTFGNASKTEASPFGTGFNKPAFGSTENATNAFAMPAAAPTSNPLGEGTGAMQGFGAPAQETLWPAAASTPPMFGGNDSKAPFAFGASGIPFNGSAPAASSQPAPSIFGSQQVPQQNPFGMVSQEGGRPGMFSSPQPESMFSSQPAAAPGLFAAQAAPPAFGAPAPSFEAPAQASAFNFGVPQNSGVFGFGAQAQQPQQAQPQPQQGVYNFGGGNGMGGMNQSMGGGMMNQPMGSVQFNMGTAPNVNVRRVRKAVRRNPQR